MKISAFDIRKVLSIPYCYTLYHHLIGDHKLRFVYVKDFIKPKKGDKIIDIGCGTGEILNYLPEVEYMGFDENQSYIAQAIRQFGNRGTFLCRNLTRETVREESFKNLRFDIALANGVLHHLNDQEALSLFDFAYHVLKPGGRLLTLDGCYTKKQSAMKKFFLSTDRGKYVRTREEYVKLAAVSFRVVESYIKHDLYRIPYTINILECQKDF